MNICDHFGLRQNIYPSCSNRPSKCRCTNLNNFEIFWQKTNIVFNLNGSDARESEIKCHRSNTFYREVGGECQYLSCVNTHTHTHFYILQLKVGKSFVRRQTNKIVGVQCKIGGREKTSDCALISSSIFFFFFEG